MKLLKAWCAGFVDRILRDYTRQASLYDEAIARWATASMPSHEVHQDLRELNVLFPTIDVYCDELARLVECFEKEKHYALPKATTMHQVRVMNFYLTSQQCLLDVPLYYEKLRTSAQLILAAYERLSADVTPSGQLQSTLYNAAPIVRNLIDLSQALASR